MRQLWFFFHLTLLFSHLTSPALAYLMGIMLALAGMRCVFLVLTYFHSLLFLFQIVTLTFCVLNLSQKDDLKTVVSYLRSSNQVSRIGLWGRSMGAVTRLLLELALNVCDLECVSPLPHSSCCSLLSFNEVVNTMCSLLYGAEDPSIAGMVLDSAFSNLFDLMMELVDVYKIRLPKFTVCSLFPPSLSYSSLLISSHGYKSPRRQFPLLSLPMMIAYCRHSETLISLFNQVKVAVQYMRRVIQKKAKFNIMDLNCLKVLFSYLFLYSYSSK